MTKRFVQYEVQFHALVVLPVGSGAPTFNLVNVREVFDGLLASQMGGKDFLSADHGMRWIAQTDAPDFRDIERALQRQGAMINAGWNGNKPSPLSAEEMADVEPRGLWWHLKQWWRE